jgi:hypothetical protein
MERGSNFELDDQTFIEAFQAAASVMAGVGGPIQAWKVDLDSAQPMPVEVPE